MPRSIVTGLCLVVVLILAEFTDGGLQHIPAYGPLPVTVPGCVDGWFTLHNGLLEGVIH